MEARDHVTQLLLRLSGGEEGIAEDLFALVYEELHREAEKCMSREAAGHTLQPTALVHEAYIRLVDGKKVEWRDRNHFFCVAARAMRNVLIDYARQRHTLKKGGGGKKVPLAGEPPVLEGEMDELLALSEALEELGAHNAELARVAELRLFGGLSVEETARAAELTLRTTERHWASARRWLNERLESA